MKLDWKEIAITAVVAILAVGLFHAFVKPMLPASVQNYIV